MGGPNPIDGETVADPNHSLGGQNLENTSDTSKRANWQVSLIGGACACIIVLVINPGVTIWSSVSLKGKETYEHGEKSNRRIIYEGSCSTSHTLSVVIHLLINIFGSILLAASNYGMQCLTAPTRADIDKAHARKQWMDIGILSFRNLRMVFRMRAILWLLFNSVVYSSLTTWSYDTFTVDEDFRLLWEDDGYYLKDDPAEKRRVENMIAGDLGKLDNLTALQCINEYGSALCGACALLIWGVLILSGPRDLKTLWNLGFGSANELTLILGLRWEGNGEKSLIWNVLLANLPQLIFSFLYFQYNSLFTCMAAVEEWSGYGNKRRSLRVSSNPRGEQRWRYFLQLPYRYSIPLLVASILMHWMLSQSIFIVAVQRSSIWELFTCGYLPIAIIFVIITAVFMATAVFITALRRLPTAMPVAASCSLAIAAACHHPDNIPQPDASVFPLQWGVMWRQREGSGLELTDHCGFSHYPIEKPQDGVHPVEMANGEAKSRCKYTEEVEAMSETNPLHQYKLEWELRCQML
ncbi:hypothetical protein FOFC_05700 [Fusarium oxysporum]|nr:hypothetical protein FOFC_05700 [Fusarium oxysporum]